ncbi:tryptophan synthase subunit alpha [Saccharothrix syringae]|uniref:Tryptophan synthase alpha chain n=1 Tax=Saccharothrix syringae TaxID=103733 RepID=A0A5Q0H0M9_SACSY|nr:tryptophan synthase subunit alpha [Saccharothrix syringae]QFZ19465.1 tryptophan synthase subunit alpha [Saccharothrix syringae]
MSVAVAGVAEHLKAAGRPLLVPYVMAGVVPDWVELVREVAAAGADAVEVGLPFSDPMLDGPTVQRAAARALDRGARPRPLLDELAGLDAGVPLVVMTYANIATTLVPGRGVAGFVDHLAGVGVRGAIVADLPLEESAEYRARAAEVGVDAVLLAAPSCDDDRCREIARASSGFVYCMSSMRITGEQEHLASSARANARRLKAMTDLPVITGFGVSTPAQAVQACADADGVVVGSALMRVLVDGAGVGAVVDAVAGFRAALSSASPGE